MALLLLATALPACEGDPPIRTTDQPVTERKRFAVLNDFSVDRGTEKLRTVDNESLEAGGGDIAILSIKRPQIDPRCIVSAELRTYLITPPDRPRQIATYPSLVFNAADKREGKDFGYVSTLLDIKPRGMLASDPNGWGTWKVTRIVKQWLSGRPFPSMGNTVPERGPLVLAIRDADGAPPFTDLVLASSDAKEHRPHLNVSYQRCNAKGHPKTG